MKPEGNSHQSVARLTAVSLRYGKTQALDSVDLEIPAGCMVGLIGPDGVGKSSLLSLISGARAVQQGQVDGFVPPLPICRKDWEKISILLCR